LHRCNALNPPNVWDDLIEEGCSHWKTKSVLGVTCKLVLSVYGIWKARNEIKFGGQPRTEEQILKMIFERCVWFRLSEK